jgi:hypothetical protein
MAPKIPDIAGQRFGRLTAERFAYSRNGAHWECLCDCGERTTVRASLLRNGTTKSCGCGSKDQARTNCRKWWDRNAHIPAEARRPLKDAYGNMVRRCTDPGNKRFSNYGGRGIHICAEWTGPAGREAFYRWALANSFEPGLQLDRIDVDGPYSPENCRFVDAITQMNNTTRNRKITWRGQTLTMAEWARKFGLSYSAMQHRVARGWDMERIAAQQQRERGNG